MFLRVAGAAVEKDRENEGEKEGERKENGREGEEREIGKKHRHSKKRLYFFFLISPFRC